MRDGNLMERILSFVFGFFFILWLCVSKPVEWLLKGLWKVAKDVLRSVYGKVVAGLATLLLAGLGLNFFSRLLN
jgi:hypothetical protein